MSNIDPIYIRTYNDTLQVLSQQLTSRFVGKVMMESKAGKKTAFNQIGSVAAAERTSRYPDTPITDTPFDRRWATLKIFDVYDLSDTMDEVKTKVDIKSAIPRRQVSALARMIDSVVITNALGTAETGEDGGTSVVFPASQTIAVDYEQSGTNTGLTVEKLIATRELFWKNEVDEEDPMNKLYMAVTARQLANLLGTTEVTSADYNMVKALVNGEVNSFMGFEFVRTERLPEGTTNITDCFAWAQSGIVLNMPVAIRGSIDKRPDKSNAWQMGAEVACSSVRLEEEKVVKVLCDTSV